MQVRRCDVAGSSDRHYSMYKKIYDACEDSWFYRDDVINVRNMLWRYMYVESALVKDLFIECILDQFEEGQICLVV